MACTCFGHLHVHLQEFLYTRWICKCPKHVEAIYENKIIVELFASSLYISLLIYMMHGHTYIKLSW